MNYIVFVVFGVLVCGCFSNVVKDDFVKSHATTDLKCAQEEIRVTRKGDTDWTAEGCGTTQKYTCWTSVGMGEGTCQKN